MLAIMALHLCLSFAKWNISLTFMSLQQLFKYYACELSQEAFIINCEYVAVFKTVIQTLIHSNSWPRALLVYIVESTTTLSVASTVMSATLINVTH